MIDVVRAHTQSKHIAHNTDMSTILFIHLQKLYSIKEPPNMYYK